MRRVRTRPASFFSIKPGVLPLDNNAKLCSVLVFPCRFRILVLKLLVTWRFNENLATSSSYFQLDNWSPFPTSFTRLGWCLRCSGSRGIASSFWRDNGVRETRNCPFWCWWGGCGGGYNHCRSVAGVLRTTKRNMANWSLSLLHRSLWFAAAPPSSLLDESKILLVVFSLPKLLDQRKS